MLSDPQSCAWIMIPPFGQHHGSRSLHSLFCFACVHCMHVVPVRSAGLCSYVCMSLLARAILHSPAALELLQAEVGDLDAHCSETAECASVALKLWYCAYAYKQNT